MPNFGVSMEQRAFLATTCGLILCSGFTGMVGDKTVCAAANSPHEIGCRWEFASLFISHMIRAVIFRKLISRSNDSAKTSEKHLIYISTRELAQIGYG